MTEHKLPENNHKSPEPYSKEYWEALERGHELQFRPAGRGHMRWVVRAMQEWRKLRRERRAA